MIILRLRTLVFRTPNHGVMNPKEATVPVDPMQVRPNGWFTRNWALVALAGILTIAGLEGYALSRGIDGAALRAALVSIGVLGGTGIGRAFK